MIKTYKIYFCTARGSLLSAVEHITESIEDCGNKNANINLIKDKLTSRMKATIIIQKVIEVV